MQGAAASVTVNVWPAIVAVPVRPSPVGFASTASWTVPFPSPVAPPTTVIHATSLEAVHAQPAGAVTPTASLTPPAPTSACVCESA